MKVTFDIIDTEIEAGIMQARAAYNENAEAQVATDAEYAAMLSLAAMEAFRGSAKRSLASKVEKLDVADVAEVAALVEAKIAAKVEVAVEEEVVTP